MDNIRVKFANPKLLKEDIEAEKRALSEGHLSDGYYTRKLEEACEKRWGGRWVAVCNGTSAIRVAMQALGSNGAMIMVPAFTFQGTFEGVGGSFIKTPSEWNGQKWTMSGVLQHNWVSVSLGGFPMVSDAYEGNCPILADDCQSFGVPAVMRDGTPKAKCFSFSASKMATCGQGGIIRFSREIIRGDDYVPRMARLIRSHGKIGRDYDHQPGCFNYAMADPLAACILSQMPRLQEIYEERMECSKKLSKACGVRGPFGATMRMAMLKTQSRRDLIRKRADERGVETRLPYKGNRRFHECGLLLPTGVLTNEEIELVAGCFR